MFAFTLIENPVEIICSWSISFYWDSSLVNFNLSDSRFDFLEWFLLVYDVRMNICSVLLLFQNLTIQVSLVSLIQMFQTLKTFNQFFLSYANVWFLKMSKPIQKVDNYTPLRN